MRCVGYPAANFRHCKVRVRHSKEKKKRRCTGGPCHRCTGANCSKTWLRYCTDKGGATAGDDSRIYTVVRGAQIGSATALGETATCSPGTTYILREAIAFAAALARSVRGMYGVEDGAGQRYYYRGPESYYGRSTVAFCSLACSFRWSGLLLGRCP